MAIAEKGNFPRILSNSSHWRKIDGPALLDGFLVTLDVAVEALSICEVRKGLRLIGKPDNAISFHYVLSGTIYFKAGEADPIICGPGCIVLIPPRVSLALAADNIPNKDIVAADHYKLIRDGMLLVDAADGETGDLRVVCGLIRANLLGSFGILDSVKDPIVSDLSDLDFVRHANAIMLEEIAEPALGTWTLVGALMKACLVPLIRRHFVHPDQQSVTFETYRNHRLNKAIASIIDAPAASHTVASLASIASMSRSTFAKEFVSAFRMTPMGFVSKTRLHHAAELLHATSIPVKAIASSIGYSSRSHFSRAFRDAYGTDPSNFRATLAKPRIDAPCPLHGTQEDFALQEVPPED